jgi:predicted nucleic acid-binding protein
LNACLDSWAVLAWLDGEQPARDRVDDLLDGRPAISWVNAVEVYYRLERDHGRTQAEEILRQLRSELEFDLPGVTRMMEVARLKAARPIALADCFAIATAVAQKAVLLTGDPEILDGDELPCPVEDLRPPDS